MYSKRRKIIDEENKKGNIISFNHKKNNNYTQNYISDPSKLIPSKELDYSTINFYRFNNFAWYIDNTFSVFNSLNNDNILIYLKWNTSIEWYDLDNNIIITRIIDIHDRTISTIRHYFDINNNRDLILTEDRLDRCVK